MTPLFNGWTIPLKGFLFQAFFHLPPVSTTQVVHLELRISSRIFDKIRNGPKWYSHGHGGNWFMKNLESKISWHCPFKYSLHALEHKNKDFSSEFLAPSKPVWVGDLRFGKKINYCTMARFRCIRRNRIKRLLSMRLVFQARTRHALNASKRMWMLSMLIMMSSAGWTLASYFMRLLSMLMGLMF